MSTRVILAQSNVDRAVITSFINKHTLVQPSQTRLISVTNQGPQGIPGDSVASFEPRILALENQGQTLFSTLPVLT